MILTMPVLGVFLSSQGLTLDIAYLCAKFDDRRHCHSRDTIGYPKFNMGHVTLTTPPSGWFVIRGPGLAVISLTAKFTLYLHSLHRYDRQWKMKKMGCFGGTYRSLKVSGNSTI